MAELMREHQHVPALAGEVDEDVGMQGRGDLVGVGTAALVRPQGSVDPILVEELGAQLAHPRREGPVGVEDDVSGLLPADLRLRAAQGRVAVPVVEGVDPQQLLLERVVALGDVVARGDGLDQRFDRAVGSLVGEVAVGDPVGVAAQAIVNRLVSQDGIEDELAHRQAATKRVGDRLGGGPALFGVARLELGKRLLQAGLSLAELDPDRGGDLFEEPVPGASGGHRLLR